MEKRRGLSRGLEALLKDGEPYPFARNTDNEPKSHVHLLIEAEKILGLLAEIEADLSSLDDRPE